MRVSGGGAAPGLQAKALESLDLSVGSTTSVNPLMTTDQPERVRGSYWSASKPMRFLPPTLDSFAPDPVRKITSGPSIRWLTGKMTISPSERKPTRPTGTEPRSLRLSANEPGHVFRSAMPSGGGPARGRGG